MGGLVASVAAAASRRIAAGVLVAAMALDALAMWTVVPVGWLWIGSRLQGSLEPGMRSYLTVLIGIPLSIGALLWVLARLNRAYEHVSGKSTDLRREPWAWLRSARGERGSTRRLNLGERILITSVLVALCIDGVWFFLLAHPSAPAG